MLYYCGRTVVSQVNRHYTVEAVYDTQTNRLDFYTINKFKDLIRRYTVEGIAILTQHCLSDDFTFKRFSAAHSKRYSAGLPQLIPSLLGDDFEIHIAEPVILGTLRYGMDFTYKNLKVKIKNGVQNEDDRKVVDVEIDYSSLYPSGYKDRVLTLNEFLVQLNELTTCFQGSNAKLLLWHITLPLMNEIITDDFAQLHIGKKPIHKILNIPIQGATYLRNTVNDDMECYISSPTRTLQTVDLRGNMAGVTANLLINSKLVDVLTYKGVILISTPNEQTIEGLAQFFKSDVELYYLGTFKDLTEFNTKSRSAMASYALMRPNRKVFFLANIVDNRR